MIRFAFSIGPVFGGSMLAAGGVDRDLWLAGAGGLVLLATGTLYRYLGRLLARGFKAEQSEHIEQIVAKALSTLRTELRSDLDDVASDIGSRVAVVERRLDHLIAERRPE